MTQERAPTDQPASLSQLYDERRLFDSLAGRVCLRLLALSAAEPALHAAAVHHHLALEDLSEVRRLLALHHAHLPHTAQRDRGW